MLAFAAGMLRHDQAALWLLARIWLLPWVLAGVALLLGWRFNRSRLLFAMLLVLLADQAMRLASMGFPELGGAISQATMLLLAGNLAMLSFWRERGVLTSVGLMRLALVLVQPLLLAAYFFGQGRAEGWRSPPLLVSVEIPGFGAVPPSLLGCLLAAGVLLFRYHRNRDPLDHGLFWAMVAGALATNLVTPGVLASYYFGVAGLILIVATLEAAHSMAFRDELTGLLARRALNETLDKLGGGYTVAMVDIDHFKKFNDRYGHDVGDQVLAMVAGRLRRVGGGGRPFRYGGEEFTILFPGRSLDDALPHLEKLRREVARAGFRLRGSDRSRKKSRGRAKESGRGGTTLSVTVSIGVAQRDSRDPHAAVIKAADKALYRAKEAGRNQVAV